MPLFELKKFVKQLLIAWLIFLLISILVDFVASSYSNVLVEINNGLFADFRVLDPNKKLGDILKYLIFMVLATFYSLKNSKFKIF